MNTQKKLILVVDDDPNNIFILGEILKDEYKIFFATSGEEALKKLHTQKIDLVLLDVVMPTMDGFAVCREIKANPKLKDTVVIFVTSKEDPKDESHGLAIGANDYLNKPVSAAIVRARMRTHLAMADGNRIMKEQNKALTLLNEEKKEMLGIAENLRVNLELERAKSIQNTKLAALGEMAGGIAHEINNPLAIIIGKAEALLQDLKNNEFTPEQGVKKLNQIIATSERIARIIQGLKVFSRNADKDPFDRVEINSIIEDILSFCSEKFRLREINLKIIRLPEIAFLECRRVQIGQVILNLLNNAYDALESLAEKWVNVDLKLLEGRLQIMVTDSGNGISPFIVDKLMQPFFTTKVVGNGTGLGLSISKGIIEDHNGQLRYDRSCANTRFIIDLPLKQNKLKVNQNQT